MTSALPDDHTVETFHHLCLALGGDQTSFTGDLLRLIAKADPGNRAALRSAFPRQVAAWEIWTARGPLTAGQLGEFVGEMLAGMTVTGSLASENARAALGEGERDLQLARLRLVEEHLADIVRDVASIAADVAAAWQCGAPRVTGDE